MNKNKKINTRKRHLCDVCIEIKPFDKEVLWVFVCDDCRNKGFWIDPIGCIHNPKESDLAKEYK